MSVFGKWQTKTFQITTGIIYLPESLKRSREGKRNEDNGLPQGMTDDAIEFEIHIGAPAGVNVRAEIDWWYARINKSSNLIIGTTRFGVDEMILNSVEASDIMASDYGMLYEATLKLKFSQKPNLNIVYSNLTADAVARAAATTDDKEKYAILNTELAAAKNLAKSLYNSMS